MTVSVTATLDDYVFGPLPEGWWRAPAGDGDLCGRVGCGAGVVCGGVAGGGGGDAVGV